MHHTIRSAFSTFSHLLSTLIRILQLAPFIKASETVWRSKHARIPPADYLGRNFLVASDLLIMERIPPVIREAQEAVIDYYCIDKHREACKLEPRNADCLLRPYLGSRRHAKLSYKHDADKPPQLHSQPGSN